MKELEVVKNQRDTLALLLDPRTNQLIELMCMDKKERRAAVKLLEEECVKHGIVSWKCNINKQRKQISDSSVALLKTSISVGKANKKDDGLDDSESDSDSKASQVGLMIAVLRQVLKTKALQKTKNAAD